MYTRVNSLFDTLNLKHARLVHGAAWLIDDVQKCSGICSEDSESANQWLAPLRKAMLSQFAVGTVDQAMMAAMQVNYGVLRLIGLTGKVLIIDEIHAYDAYMSQIIKRLLSWCASLGIPVIMLSATLPVQKKKELLIAYGANVNSPLSAAYPLITQVLKDGSIIETAVKGVHMKRRFEIKTEPVLGDKDETAKIARDAVLHGGCICLMLNTVDQAQKVYLKLKEICDKDTKLLIFHARFPAYRRQEIEQNCIDLFGKDAGEKRPKKCILVCTQVVEQSLDLDFDFFITELAPIDLLLQRFGRLHRHDSTIRPGAYSAPKAIVLLDKDSQYEPLPIYAAPLMKRTEI
jgi:CRISPR-associated endonuclease/helicase Cas3